MSATVDNRVVSLEFDNDKFSEKIESTLKALEELDKKLNIAGSTDAFSKVGKDVDATNQEVNGLATGVETAGKSFSKLEIMGITALANITNSVVNLGKKLASNLISPITQGGLQRALNIEQANFQFEGQGIERKLQANGKLESSYGEVMNAVLGTAYSYDVAAKAAAQLAASGIGVTKVGEKEGKEVYQLNSSMTKALLGIAGVASMTGSSFEDMSQIFTRVAGQGRVFSNDLNSIAARGINAASYIAKYLNNVNDTTEYTEAKVREMVTKGQIDFETFSNAMSWAFGDHAKDSTKMFTGALEDVKAALSRIGADFYGPALEAARDVLNSMVPAIDIIHARMGGLLKESAVLMDKLSKKFSLALDVFSTIATKDPLSFMADYPDRFNGVLKAFGITTKVTMKDFTLLATRGVNLAKIIGKTMGKSEDEIRQMAKEGKLSLTMVAKSFVDFANAAKDPEKALKELKPIMDAVLGNHTSANLEKLKSIFEGLVSLFNAGKKVFSSVFHLIGSIFTGLAPVGGILLSAAAGLATFVSGVTDAVANLKIFEKIGKGVETAASGLETIFNMLGRVISNAVESMGGITHIFDTLIDVVSNAANKLLSSAGLAGLITLFLEFSNMAIRIKKGPETIARGLSSLYSNLVLSVEGLYDSLRNLVPVLKAYTTQLNAKTLQTVAVSVGIFALSMKLLSTIDVGGLARATVGLGVAMGALIALMNALASTDGFKKMIILSSMTTSIIKASIAIIIMAKALEILSDISYEGIAKGLISIKILGDILTNMAVTLSKTKGIAKGMLGLIAIAASIKILAGAMEDIAKISWSGIIKGLLSIEILFKSLSSLTNKIGNPEGFIKTSLGLVIISGALVVISKAMTNLSDISWGGLVKGIGSIALVLTALGVFVKAMSSVSSGDILKISVSMVVISESLKIIADAISVLGGLNVKELVKGLGAIVVSLTAFGVLIKALSGISAGNVLAVGASILMVSASLKILSGTISTLGNMGLGSLAKGLIGLAVALGVIVGAMWLLSPVVPVLLAFGGAMLMIGGSAALFGAGLTLIGTGLISVAAGLTAVGSSLAAVPQLIATFVKGLFDGLAQSIKSIKDVIVGLITSILDAAKQTVPAFFETLQVMLDSAITFLVNNGPRLIETGLTLLMQFLQTLSNNAYQFGVVGANFITNFINGVSSKLPDLIDAGFKMVIDFINGLADAIENNMPKVMAAIGHLGLSIIKGLMNTVAQIPSIGAQMITSLVKGLSKTASNAAKSALKIGSSILQAIKSTVSSWATVGRQMIQGLWNGIGALKDWVIGKVAKMGSAILSGIKRVLGIKSPSKKFAEVGKFIMLGLSKGIDDNSTEVEKSVDQMAGVLNGIYSSLDSYDFDSSPIITPIVDLSNASSSLNTLDSMFSTQKAMDISATFNRGKTKEQLIGESLRSATEDLATKLSAEIQNGMGKSTTVVEVPVVLDGREIARASAPYSQEELNRLETQNNRALGLI